MLSRAKISRTYNKYTTNLHVDLMVVIKIQWRYIYLVAISWFLRYNANESATQSTATQQTTFHHAHAVRQQFTVNDDEMSSVNNGKKFYLFTH